TEPDSSLRLTDVGVLKALFAHAVPGVLPSAEGEGARPASAARVIGELLGQLAKRNQRLRRGASEAWFQQVTAAGQGVAAVVPPGEAVILVDEDQWGTEHTVAGRRAI